MGKGTMMMLKIAFIAAALAASPALAEVEKPAAVDGTGASTVAVTPTFFSTNLALPQSYLRFFNGSTTTDSTFTVTIVGVPSGTTYGSAVALAIPARASIQYALIELVRRTGATPGTFSGTDTGYAVYIKNTDKTAGYAHVVYDATNDLFENHSNCTTPLNQQMAAVNNELVLTNVHTSKLGDGKYPSTIEIYNSSLTAQTYTLKVYNGGAVSATGGPGANSGKLTCVLSGNTVLGNARLQLSMANIEANSQCALDSDEYYANIAVTTSTGATPAATLAHLIQVTKFNGTTNMTQACAVNPVATTTTAPAVATPAAYCGSVLAPTVLGRITLPFVLSVAPNGKVKGYGYTEYAGYSLGDYVNGQVTGTTITVFSLDGTRLSGTIQNGAFSGTYTNPLGTGSFSGSTAACSN